MELKNTASADICDIVDAIDTLEAIDASAVIEILLEEVNNCTPFIGASGDGCDPAVKTVVEFSIDVHDFTLRDIGYTAEAWADVVTNNRGDWIDNPRGNYELPEEIAAEVDRVREEVEDDDGVHPRDHHDETWHRLSESAKDAIRARISKAIWDCEAREEITDELTAALEEAIASEIACCDEQLQNETEDREIVLIATGNDTIQAQGVDVEDAARSLRSLDPNIRGLDEVGCGGRHAEMTAWTVPAGIEWLAGDEDRVMRWGRHEGDYVVLMKTAEAA
jgi:hypothetical protein